MVLEAGERVDLNTIDALKNALFNVGIVFRSSRSRNLIS